MIDEAAVAAAPEAVAAPAVETSAPVSAPDTRTMSDEQILESATAPEVAAAPEAAKTDVVDPEAPEPGKLDYRRVPAALREMVKADPSLESTFEVALGLTDIGLKLAEVKAMKEAIGEGGLEGLTNLKAELDSVRQTDEAFFSNDPAKQTEVVAGMFAEHPEAVVGAFKATAALLAEKSPEQYSEIASSILENTLKGAGFDDFAAQVASALQSGDTAAQGKLLGEMLGWLQQSANIGLSSEQSLKLREEAVKRMEQSNLDSAVNAEQAKFTEFTSGVNDQSVKATDAAISEVLDKLLPKDFNANMRTRIAKETADAIHGTLKASTQFQEEIAKLMRTHVFPQNYDPQSKGVKGFKLTPEGQKVLSGFVAGQAKALVAPTLEKILPEWIEGFAASANDKAKKAAAAAGRVDISSGAGSGPKLVPAKVNYRKQTDEEILEM